ncbi:hypothetical protein ACET3Z_018514 [Daucus carota]
MRRSTIKTSSATCSKDLYSTVLKESIDQTILNFNTNQSRVICPLCSGTAAFHSPGPVPGPVYKSLHTACCCQIKKIQG